MDFFTLKTQKNKDTINFNPVVPMRPYSSLTVGRLGQTLLTLLLPVCSYSALTQSEAGANPVNPAVTCVLVFCPHTVGGRGKPC